MAMTKRKDHPSIALWPAAVKPDLPTQITVPFTSVAAHPTEPLGKRLRVFRLCKAKHHEVAVVAARGICERRRREGRRSGGGTKFPAGAAAHARAEGRHRGHEQPPDAMPPHAAERHWAHRFIIPGHSAS
jgi:hypothetical protein